MSKDLVKAQPNAVTTEVDFGFSDPFAGDSDKLIMPVAKVMQPTSELLQDENYSFRQGDIVNSLLAEKLPEKFSVLTYHEANIFFLPKNDAEKKKVIKEFGLPEDFSEMFICRAPDGRTPQGSRIGKTDCGSCGLNKFGWDGNPDTPPVCTNSLNFLALFEDQEAPVVIQFANTSRREGKKLYSLIAYTSRKAPWTKMYKLTSRKESNDKGVYWVLQVSPAGNPTPEQLKLATIMAREFAGVQYVAADEADKGPEQMEINF